MKKEYIISLVLLLVCTPIYVQQESDAVQASVNNQGFFDDENDENESTEINVEEKQKAVIDLVNRGIDYMSNKPLDEALSLISHSPDLTFGELYLFVYDTQGVCFAHGHHENLIWNNLWDMRDMFGTLIVQNIIKKANEGAGWLTYGWRNTTKTVYVKKTVVEGKEYVVGSGYYPYSKKDSAVSLVKSAVAMFNQALQAGRTTEEIFAVLSYPLGQFVLGDLYLFALNFEGIIMAQGDSPGLIGNSAWNSVDTKGVKINQKMIEDLKKLPNAWISYVSKNAKKIVYAEKVADKVGKQYFIACGYYPDTDRKQAVDLLRKGFKFMKVNGLSAVSESISNINDPLFSYGDLYLVLYSKEGDCLAHGNNPALVGHNFWNFQDQDGKYYVRDMINKALIEPGWVDSKLRNLFKSTYVEKIELGSESYIMTCGLYPISKRESAVLLVKTAGDYLKDVSRQVAFNDFAKADGRFIRGDLHMFVFDFDGYCYVYGDTYNLIWKNLIDAKDDDGKAYVQLFINTAKNGAGQVSFKLNKRDKIGYVESVEKDGKTYVVGSSYYV